MNTKMQRQNVLENKKNSVDVSQNLNSIMRVQTASSNDFHNILDSTDYR